MEIACCFPAKCIVQHERLLTHDFEQALAGRSSKTAYFTSIGWAQVTLKTISRYSSAALLSSRAVATTAGTGQW